MNKDGKKLDYGFVDVITETSKNQESMWEQEIIYQRWSEVP